MTMFGLEVESEWKLDATKFGLTSCINSGSLIGFCQVSNRNKGVLNATTCEFSFRNCPVSAVRSGFNRNPPRANTIDNPIRTKSVIQLRSRLKSFLTQSEKPIVMHKTINNVGQ